MATSPKLPAVNTGNYWDTSPVTQQLIDLVDVLETAVSALDELERVTRQGTQRNAEEEELYRWVQGLSSNVWEAFRDAGERAMQRSQAELARRDVIQRAAAHSAPWPSVPDIEG